MRFRASIIGIVIGVCWALASIAGTPEPAGTLSADEFIRRLFAEVEAQPAECPENIADFSGSGEARCASVGFGWRGLKKRVDRWIQDELPASPSTEMTWTLERFFRSRYYLARDRPLRMLFDVDEQILAVLPGHPCFDPSLIESLRIETGDGEPISPPERVHYVRPDYPERARVNRSNGRVIVEAVILRDGTVDDVCLLSVHPAGMDFEWAALRAVKQWRYRPAESRGAPVDTRFIIKLDWALEPR